MKLNRRTFLRGMLAGSAVSIGLPSLEAMFDANATAYAHGGAIPRRFGIWYWPNGNHLPTWTPEGTGTDWQLSDALEPFARVKQDITVVTGLEVKVPNTVTHYSGLRGMLSGVPTLGDEQDHTWAGPSIDQMIAAEIGHHTPFRSLEVAVAGGTISANGPHNINPAEERAERLFSRVFGASFQTPDGTTDPRIALRRSVLDAVADQTRALHARVGAADKHRLDQHLTGIRDLELRLAHSENSDRMATCVPPEGPPEPLDSNALQARHRLIGDILIQAIACDVTRVFTLAYCPTRSNWLYPGLSSGHHVLTHQETGDRPKVQQITKQTLAEAAWFVERLRELPEGDGSLLDHMGLLICSDVSDGRVHRIDEMPIVVAGSCGGAFKMGLHHRETRVSTSRLMLSFIRAMGINRAAYGEGAARATTSLHGIET